MEQADVTEQEVQSELTPAETLMGIMQLPNIAAELPEQRLNDIAHRAIKEYQIDKDSRSEWEEIIKKATDLAMLTAEQKDYPFEKASNVKYPLLTVAALQFNARSYPAIVQGNRVVKCSTWGSDPQGQKAARAERVAEHMSYQFISEMPEWEEDTDRLTVMLPICGSMFRKVYFDPSLGRKVTRLIPPDRMVVNYGARSIEETPRSTEEMPLYPFEIQERIRDGRFIEFDYGVAQTSATKQEDEGTQDGDEDAPHLFLEQHRLIDLDDDGYPEPYVVTVHKDTETICRIVANYDENTVMVDEKQVYSIRPQQYYIHYTFLPSPDGGFYGWGFGWLLKGISEAINTTLNQMLDAGHLANVQGGLVSANLGIKDRTIRLKMGEWRVVNTNTPLNQGVMPITYPGPSDVLFKLLGALIEAGQDIASIKDVLVGETKAGQTASGTMALIEQGLQVFTSIYKRIHRALKKELQLHGRLNAKHLSPEQYTAFHDEIGEDGQAAAFDPQQDYERTDDIMPVTDPNMVSRMQQLAKAQFLEEWSAEKPFVNHAEVGKRVLDAAQVDDPEGLFAPPPEPDPEEEILKRILAELALEDQEAQIMERYTKAIKNIADAEAAEEGPQIDRYKLIADLIKAEVSAEQVQANGQGRISGMEGAAGNAMGAEAPAGPGGPNSNPTTGPAIPLNGG